jgi:hypothetical protein
MISKQIKILLVLIMILVSLGTLFLNRDDSNETSTPTKDELIKEEIQPTGKWEPLPVISCEEIFTNQYHVTFENGVTILTNKTAKIGDTTKCWINKTIDSLVFEKP